MKKPLLAALLFILAVPMLVLGQQRQITGRVTNESGQPLSLASIIIKGTSTGTTADDQGRFSITVPSSNSVLVISATGHRETELTLGSADSYNVNLKAADDLSVVVITALGITRKERSLGYATQQVKGENLTLTKEQNVISSLAGKIAGVQVVGAPGASMGGTSKIKIRGVNSITGGGEPLIVVDGTPISNANFAGRNGGDYGNLAQDINPDDIESVNVLKGPAASALYGIRGQYGVLMITTKKGGKGAKKVNVQYSSAFSIEKTINFIPLQNVYGGGSSQTWRTLGNGQKYVDMSIDESWGPKMDDTTMVRSVFSFYPQDPEYGKLTPFSPHPSNVEDYYVLGNTLNNSITVTGGNENTTFRLSYNNTRIKGTEPNTWLRRNNLGLSAGIDITSKLNAAANISYATNKGQRPSQGYDGGSRYLMQWFQRNIDMNRLKQLRYSDGTYINWNLNRPTAAGVITYKPIYWNNPYFEAYENLNSDSRDRFFGDVGLTYKLLPGLKVSGFVRSDIYMQNIETREAEGGRYPSEYTSGKYHNKEMNYELLAQYNKTWGELSLNANLGGNIYSRQYTEVVGATAGGLSSPGYYNLAASKDRPRMSSYLLKKQIRSRYAMASLGYKDMYFLDASIRNDISSTLPEDNNSYWYPSVSGSFLFSELLNWRPLSYAKFRVSYAQAGSDLSPYQIIPTFSVGGTYSTTNTLSVPDNLPNPDIKPSYANSYEVGTDLQFFNNRLGASLTYYMQRNKNQIINLDVSGASGVGSTIINAGLIENKGVELTLTGSPVRGKNFSWDVTFNLARNKGMVKELYGTTNSYDLDVNTYSGVSVYLKSFVGKPFGSLVGKAYQRDSATGKILLGSNNLPLYTEANYDFGTVVPDYTGGILNTFRVFGFDIGAMIDYQLGGQFFSWTQMMAVKTGMAEMTAAINDKGKNVREPLADGGGVKVTGISSTTKQEVTAYVDARAYFRTTLGTHVYEEWLYDASYIKLRELRLGKTFQKTTFPRLPFSSITVAFIARNPAMLWQKAPKGLDPSELSVGGSAISWLETGNLNSVRSYGINLNINF